jgi:hypothetical protein
MGRVVSISIISLSHEILLLGEVVGACCRGAEGGRFAGARGLVGALFTWAQRISRSRAAGQRRPVLRADNWIEESLTFAGGHAV